jgi:cell division protein FtsL
MNTGRRANTATAPRLQRAELAETDRERSGSPSDADRASAPKRPSLRVLPRPSRRRRRVGVLAVVATTLVFGFMIGLATFQAQLASNQLQLDAVEQQLHAAELTYERHRAEVTRLESPQRIVAEATKLGMTSSGKPRYLTPSAATLTEVLVAAGGGPEAEVTAGGPTRPDWSTYKNATGQ